MPRARARAGRPPTCRHITRGEPFPQSATARRPGARDMRTRLTYVEEIWQLRDPPDETANIQLELRVSGPLDESRLREAVGAAATAHPMTRARQAARRGR